ncbi:MAG: type VI secretion system baseplate subunit TssF [Planctomycetes bacterium]|nr:type VI secretion system baseplate subunit TssF [Planctomycetota bacterium]
MTFNKYYQDELLYLRELGREFSTAHPEAAGFLAEPGSDPDVERLIEGFAFLTARVREKLDDELPELTHALMEMFWPHYLRPVPSITTLQFDAMAQAAKESRTIASGAEIDSVPVDGTPCRFRSVYDVNLQPITLQGVELRRGSPPVLALKFKFADGITAAKANISSLRLHLAGETAVSRALYLCLTRYFTRAVAQPLTPPGQGVSLDAKTSPVGFAGNEAMLAYPNASFSGFRLLQEYFIYPAKFMYVELTGLQGLSKLGAATHFELQLQLSRLVENMPPVSAGNVLLNCTPAINLFKHDADPIRVDLQRTEYFVRPSGSDGRHFEIYSIDRVAGMPRGTNRLREYRPLFRLSSRPEPDAVFYRARIHPAVTGEGTNVMISLTGGMHNIQTPEIETLSIELSCTNRNLPTKLGLGDVSVTTSNAPNFARAKNITRPTASIAPPMGDDLHWRLLSHLSLNYLSLIDLESLRSLIGLYNFRARVDRQAENAHRLMLAALEKISARPAIRLVQGAPVRGMEVELEVGEDGFGGEGEAYLFGSVLSEFLAQYVSLNAFSRLSLKGTKYGEVHTWPARSGKRTLL